ncbi:uncharacterized protein LOC135427117 [Drosophila montana]|uniref:uncharacterized protein LOC135427117 n=1 Tax=Drosophila montana TaxID=40370 RepID=UPI00313DB572
MMSSKNLANYTTHICKELVQPCRCMRPMGYLAARCMGSFKCDKATVTVKKTCIPVEKIQPEYYKQRKPCKPDTELRANPSLGYPRCDIPYNPTCMGLCFNKPRLDTRLYKPSKSLHRPFQVNWIECVLERKRAKRCAGKIMLPEIKRRKIQKPYCPRCVIPKCSTMKPMPCKPFKPALPTSEERCIKFPLCECPKGRERTRCKINMKVQTTCKRLRTRYPSFSECDAAVNVALINECYSPPSICEMWRSFKSRYSG